MRMKTAAVLLALMLCWVSGARAEEPFAAYLDPPYPDLKHPVRDVSPGLADEVGKSDVVTLLSLQTPVRMQGQRGTCAIFSSTALIEFLLRKVGGAPADVDLSEEWLEYLAVRDQSRDGSSTERNLRLIAEWGMPEEKLLPYLGETWSNLNQSPLAKERCGGVPERYLRSCLLAHRDPRLLEALDAEIIPFDPDFVKARDQAARMRRQFMRDLREDFAVLSVSQVRTLLRQGIPLVLDVDFFYGAWNHNRADNLGIGRDGANFARGIVGYPEPGSVDRLVSRRERAGHSVLVVGYDDSATLTYPLKMTDGSVRTFERPGVYYFKNSWGTEYFGSEFAIAGRKYPGYGAISADYAHEYGQFFQVPVQ